MPKKTKFKHNAINQGDGLELLRYLPDNSVKLVFFDPQYEKVKQVLKRNYPLAFQPDEQINQFCREIARALKPSGFCLLWVNKTVLSTARVLSSPVKDCGFIGLVQAKYSGYGFLVEKSSGVCFFIAKQPANHKLFKNRGFGNVWAEDQLIVNKRNHPHQKPKGLIKALIEATTEKGNLIVDPCAGSFIVLEVCQETKREFLGCDLTYQATREFMSKGQKARQGLSQVCLDCWEFIA